MRQRQAAVNNWAGPHLANWERDKHLKQELSADISELIDHEWKLKRYEAFTRGAAAPGVLPGGAGGNVVNQMAQQITAWSTRVRSWTTGLNTAWNYRVDMDGPVTKGRRYRAASYKRIGKFVKWYFSRTKQDGQVPAEADRARSEAIDEHLKVEGRALVNFQGPSLADQAEIAQVTELAKTHTAPLNLREGFFSRKSKEAWAVIKDYALRTLTFGAVGATAEKVEGNRTVKSGWGLSIKRDWENAKNRAVLTRDSGAMGGSTASNIYYYLKLLSTFWIPLVRQIASSLSFYFIVSGLLPLAAGAAGVALALTGLKMLIDTILFAWAGIRRLGGANPWKQRERGAELVQSGGAIVAGAVTAATSTQFGAVQPGDLSLTEAVMSPDKLIGDATSLQYHLIRTANPLSKAAKPAISTLGEHVGWGAARSHNAAQQETERSRHGLRGELRREDQVLRPSAYQDAQQRLDRVQLVMNRLVNAVPANP